MDRFSFLNTVHTGFIEDLYQQYLKDPDTVEPSWKSFFQGYDLANSDYSLEPDQIDVEIPQQVYKEFKVIELINGYRTRGHLFTKTNPVRNRRPYSPTLELQNFGLDKNDLESVFNAGSILGLQPTKLSDIINHFESIYCDSIGIEYMYIMNPEEIQLCQEKLNENDNELMFSFVWDAIKS